MKKLFTLFIFQTLVCFCILAQKPVYLDDTKPIETRIDDLMSRLTLEDKIAIIHAQSKFSSPGIKRLGLPDFWTDDGPHGVRPDVLWDEWEQAGQTNDSCVAFPALTCLAATWNPQLSYNYGRALGEEARYRGKDMILGPGVNIYRTPLNGRNFEYMGEDPYLASVMVAPYVQGLQSTGVAACVKHFALNNHETNRHTTNINLSDRALYEIYLPAFKAAVQQGGAWGVMGAYNLYKNIHNCYNPILVNQILKGEWGFDGVLVSDWGGAHDTHQAVVGGLDMEFGSWTNGLDHGYPNAYDSYYLAQPYKELIQAGKYTTRELDDKVRRVLRLFFRTTLNNHRAQGFMCSDEHYEVARDVAQEGIVLLKNKGGVLPINTSTTKRVLVVGENAIKMMTVGGGSSSLKVQHEILPLDGLKTRLEKENIIVDYARGYVGDTTGNYNGVTTGQNLVDMRTPQQLIDEAVAKASQADYVVVFGGLNKSMHQDAEDGDRLSYGLPYDQDRLVEALAQANKNLIFVNISGNAVAMPWADAVSAIVQGWFLGSETGTSLASILVGDANPSGKLPFTWYEKLEDCGAHRMGNFPGVKRSNEDIFDIDYAEGLYVGYRGVDKFKTRPLFAFGHGLSYTSFALTDAKADKKEITATDSITFTVNVTNTGKLAGSETVQLYITDVKSSLERPLKELKGFKKVRLNAGETQAVSITVGRDALSYFDDKQHQWVAEPGDFIARIGTSSDNISAQVKFKLK